MTRIFTFSPAYLRTLQITNMNVFINLCIALFIFLHYFTVDHHIEPLTYLIVLCVAMLAAAVRHFMMKLQLKQQLVVISEKGLFKKSGSTLERLDFRKVLTIYVWEDGDGNIAAVHFVTTKGKFKLHGFENMEEMLELIRPHVEDLVVVNRKRLTLKHLYDLMLHLLLYAIAALITILYVFVPVFHTLLHYSLWLIPAIFLSVGRPVSKMFGRWIYKWECLIAFLLIGLFVLHL